MQNAFIPTRLLIIDDAPDSIAAAAAVLQTSDYELHAAVNAHAALNLIKETPPDLILLDYEMPVCSGPQVLEMIRNEAATREIPVIFLTAKSDRDSVMKVLSLKPEGYLLKTKTPDEIKESIAAFFATRKVQELQNPGE